LQHTHDILRERLLVKAGLSDTPKKKLLTLEGLIAEVKRTTWDEKFLGYMFNRLLMGRLRYGPKDGSGPAYNYAKSIADKVRLYMETGNTECLVDIGNYCMLEFRFGAHPNRHFSSTDDSDHCELL